MSITLQDIGRAASAQTQFTQVACREVLEASLSYIAEQLALGEDIVLKGVGRLRTRIRPARTARNPNDGSPVAVSAKRVVKFVPRGDLKSQLEVVEDQPALDVAAA